jgi:hypothetical protein
MDLTNIKESQGLMGEIFVALFCFLPISLSLDEQTCKRTDGQTDGSFDADNQG